MKIGEFVQSILYIHKLISYLNITLNIVSIRFINASDSLFKDTQIINIDINNITISDANKITFDKHFCE